MKQALTLNYEIFAKVSELTDLEQNLVVKAFEASDNAYSPYSKFKVGAAVLLENNEIVLGNNQENMAYPSGLCAERVALFYVGANFGNESIKTLVIVAKGDFIASDAKLSPCGNCRQVMAESQLRQSELFPIILVNMDGSVTKFESINSLLPFTFGA